MTDVPMGGRGGVGIRLWVDGGEVVKRTFGQIGDSGRKMWAEIAMGEKAANPALRAVSRVSKEAQGGIESLGARAGVAGTALSAFGATGVAVAAGLGGLVVAMSRAREAMSFAAVLTDTSEKLAINAERLQELRFVADEAGVPVSALEADLEKLTGTLGKFKAGIGDGKLKPWFEELGISKEDLDSIQTADELMMLLADRLGQVEDRSKQVAAARALGIEDSLPILRLGSEAIADLAAKSRDLGLVMDDEVRIALDRADRQMEIAQQRIDMSLRLSVAGLADEFATLAGKIADAVSWLHRFSSADGDGAGGIAPRMRAMGMRQVDDGFGMEKAEAFSARDYLDSAYIRGLRASSGFEMQGHSTARGGGRGGRSTAADAERIADQRRQREERAADRRIRAWQDFRASLYDPKVDLDEALDRELAKLEADRAERLREIERQEEEYIRSDGLRGLAAGEAKLIKVLDDLRHEQDQERAITERLNAGLRHRLETEAADAEAAMDMLSVRSAMARTTKERLTLERQILEIERAAARDRLALELGADPNVSDEDRFRRLGQYDRQTAAELALFDQRARDELQSEFHAAGREIVSAIEEGRIGEHIAEDLKARLIEMALAGLFNFLNPQGGEGSGGFWDVGARVVGSLFGLGPGRAGGGGLHAGRRHPVVETGRPELLMLGGQGHVVGAQETARLLEQMSSGPARGSMASGGPQDFGALDITLRTTREFDATIRRVSRAEAQREAATAGARTYQASVAAAPGAVAERRAYRE